MKAEHICELEDSLNGKIKDRAASKGIPELLMSCAIKSVAEFTLLDLLDDEKSLESMVKRKYFAEVLRWYTQSPVEWTDHLARWEAVNASHLDNIPDDYKNMLDSHVGLRNVTNVHMCVVERVNADIENFKTRYSTLTFRDFVEIKCKDLLENEIALERER
jgi:hypothetical protein